MRRLGFDKENGMSAIFELRISTVPTDQNGEAVFFAGVCGAKNGLGVYNADPVECAKDAVERFFKAYPLELQSVRDQACALRSEHGIEPSLVQGLHP